jgi:hypothetical protein
MDAFPWHLTKLKRWLVELINQDLQEKKIENKTAFGRTATSMFMMTFASYLTWA